MNAVVPHPKQDEWDAVLPQMLALANVTSLKDFEKHALHCNLEVVNGQMVAIPCRKIGINKGYEDIDSGTIRLPFIRRQGRLGPHWRRFLESVAHREGVRSVMHM